MAKNNEARQHFEAKQYIEHDEMEVKILDIAQEDLVQKLEGRAEEVFNGVIETVSFKIHKKIFGRKQKGTSARIRRTINTVTGEETCSWAIKQDRPNGLHTDLAKNKHEIPDRAAT